MRKAEVEIDFENSFLIEFLYKAIRAILLV